MSAANKITNTFDNLLSKYRSNGLTKVVDFLSSIARRSKRTAFAYSFALDHFNKFIERQQNYNYNIETILEPLKKSPDVNGGIDVYTLLDRFVSYLYNDTINGHDLSSLSVKLYMAAVKSYLSHNDIELTASKFKRRVKMPRIYREDEEAVDAKDIRQILLACNNRRLKAYLLVLASGGMRATEALAIRLRDLDFSISPTKVHIRKEFAKTRVARDIYISDEATRFLKQWIEWKYRDRKYALVAKKVRSEDDTVFSIISSSKDPHALYTKVLLEFQKVLKDAGLISRKEEGVYKRRKITFHSFRRFVKTTLSMSNDAGYEYSEWFLGHSAKSPYYSMKEEKRRDIYAKCMKYFTYLDYSVLEAKGKDFDSRLEEKDTEIAQLKQRDTANTEAIAKMQSELDMYHSEIIKLTEEIKTANEAMQLRNHSQQMHTVTKKLEFVTRLITNKQFLNMSNRERQQQYNEWLKNEGLLD